MSDKLIRVFLFLVALFFAVPSYLLWRNAIIDGWPEDFNGWLGLILPPAFTITALLYAIFYRHASQMDETLQKHMDKKTGCGKVIFVTLFSILFILVGAEVIVSHVVKHEPVQTWEYYAYTLIFVLWVVGIVVKLKNTNIMKNVVVISTSLRPGSNSNMLAEQFAEGARAAGHQVEFISLRDKEIKFCIGCLSCQKTGACVIEDDVPAIMESVLNADVVCWATPIYYYEMSGQMKTLIDRMNAMYPKDYRFREVYLLTTAAENEDYTSAGTENGLMGWIECYEKSELKGHLFCGGVGGPKEIEGNAKLQEAYELGKQV